MKAVLRISIVKLVKSINSHQRRYTMPDFLDFSESLKNLSREQLLELQAQMEQAQKATAEPEKLPIKVALEIHVNDSNQIDPAELHAALSKAAGDEPFPITLDEMRTLQAIQAEIVKWIDSSKEHAALFAVNPVSALRRSGVLGDEALLEKLETLMKASPGFAALSGVEIESATLQATSI
ncbi:hypothetical protein HJG54_22290 [Leptolyngbya sp. NK1-12]|uniref:Uncharacterized protein n=1 Tax=Leptolyngbya sp. NK1-12 TaxID=2547451 RepID=A0AA96WMS0_9CYAN|nr:hypothetical protein [Leptolyngbya sp. NK1-12]WNZ25311.1 hypothetical protein HJG54_22290 [Leptolyngbya sp. NK1-12]